MSSIRHRYVAYASRTENQDAIDASIVDALHDMGRARAGIKLLDSILSTPLTNVLKSPIVMRHWAG